MCTSSAVPFLYQVLYYVSTAVEKAPLIALSGNTKGENTVSIIHAKKIIPLAISFKCAKISDISRMVLVGLFDPVFETTLVNTLVLWAAGFVTLCSLFLQLILVICLMIQLLFFHLRIHCFGKLFFFLFHLLLLPVHLHLCF